MNARLPGLAALRGASYLHKWLLFSALIGIVAGLGAIAFVTGLHLATHVLLGFLAGYVPPAPVGEGGGAGSAGFSRPLAVPIVTGLGGLVSGLLVFAVAPEAEGHGTDAAIWAFHPSPSANSPIRPHASRSRTLRLPARFSVVEDRYPE